MSTSTLSRHHQSCRYRQTRKPKRGDEDPSSDNPTPRSWLCAVFLVISMEALPNLSRPSGLALALHSLQRPTFEARCRRDGVEPQYDSELSRTASSLNPRQWTKRKKWAHAAIAASMMLTALVTASTTALTYEGLYKAQQVSAAFSLLPYALFLAGPSHGSNINRVCGIWLGRKALLSHPPTHDCCQQSEQPLQGSFAVFCHADCWQAWREVRREAKAVE